MLTFLEEPGSRGEFSVVNVYVMFKYPFTICIRLSKLVV
jgi:hypothetical protein